MELTFEAYRDIVNYVGNRSDIATLCRVSKTLRRVAERALYNTIFLQGTHETIILCTTLSSSPRLAALVDALTISLLEDDDSSDESEEQEQERLRNVPENYWPSISQALERTTCLRYLNIHSQNTSISACAWIFGNCKFLLRSFHCDFDWDDDLIAFLNTQTDLEDLYILDFKETHNGNETTHTTEHQDTAPSTTLHVLSLPKLTTLECTFSEAADNIVPHRPVSRVKTCFSRTEITAKRAEMARLFSNLSLSTRPILSLDIADSCYNESFAMELLRVIVSTKVTSTQLRYLGTLVLPIQGQERLQFYGLLMRLPLLRCIEVEVSEWVPPPSTPAAFRALANELRLYCPSVTCVVFVQDFERTVATVVRGVCTVNADVGTDLLWREIL